MIAIGSSRAISHASKQPNRHVVLIAFFGTWCPPCIKQLDPLEKVYQKFKDDRVKFFIIDNTEHLRKDLTNDWDGFRNAPITGELFKEMNINIAFLEDINVSVS